MKSLSQQNTITVERSTLEELIDLRVFKAETDLQVGIQGLLAPIAAKAKKSRDISIDVQER